MLEVNNIIQIMVGDTNRWKRVHDFVKKVLRCKEQDETRWQSEQ